MNFNFYEEFKSHSNEELIAIARQTDAYQTEAVAAAYQHLNEREVSENEILGITEAPQNYSGESSQGEQEDLLVPYLTDPAPQVSYKWINVLLCIIAFQFFYNLSTRLWYFFKYKLSFTLFFNLESLIIFIVFPVLFLMVLKRKKLAWFILFSIHLYTGLTICVTQGIAVAYGYVNNYSNLLVWAFAVVINTSYVIILWKEIVANTFSVSTPAKQKTAIIVAVATVLILLAKQ
ncbi:hypothetical protein [Pinibacter soli]|uniref:Uncharacterized protein n=1 Tax=Pinibacter soli TaxID=3044211 RepID=A0ABT6RCK5_9BACT|nr:hypothetical protein [Pinibacter soli]MDI3320206.1 hypothetical protein [Pinibacter soli]